MPTFRHGKSTAILLNGFDMSAYLNQASTSRSVETGETTAFGNSSKTYITGLADSTMSLSGLFEASTSAGSDPVLSGQVGDATDDIISVLPEGNTVGRRCLIGQGLITSYEVSASVGDVVSISAEFQNDGGADGGIILAAATSVTTAPTTNGTGQDNAASTTNGGCATLHVTANANTGTTTFKVQHSTDNSTWTDLVSFSTVATTVTGAQYAVVAAGTTVNRYLRAQATTANTGNITYTMSFARR